MQYLCINITFPSDNVSHLNSTKLLKTVQYDLNTMSKLPLYPCVGVKAEVLKMKCTPKMSFFSDFTLEMD